MLPLTAGITPVESITENRYMHDENTVQRFIELRAQGWRSILPPANVILVKKW